MKNKNLVIFMPSIEGGGVEKNLFLISNYLSSKMKNIYLITASKKHKYKFNKNIKLIFPISNFWESQNRMLKYLICIFLLIKTIVSNRNSIIFSFQANLYSILIAKLFNIKIIIRSNSAPAGWSSNFFKTFIFKTLLKKADKIIVNSLDFKKQLYDKFKVSSECIYNPLNKFEILKLSQKKIRISNSKNKDEIKLINIGRFVDQKDQITLLKAINEIKGKIKIKLTIIGRGTHKKMFENYIVKNQLKKIITIVGFQKNPYPLIKGAEVFILSSKYEGLPNVLLEALVLNKFVISSDCPTGPSEILSKGKGGLLFKIGDYKDLANKILYYSKNKKDCNKKLKYSRDQLYRFSYKNNLKKYFDIIKRYT